jgi:hypothetical protein
MIHKMSLLSQRELTYLNMIFFDKKFITFNLPHFGDIEQSFLKKVTDKMKTAFGL